MKGLQLYPVHHANSLEGEVKSILANHTHDDDHSISGQQAQTLPLKLSSSSHSNRMSKKKLINCGSSWPFASQNPSQQLNSSQTSLLQQSIPSIQVNKGQSQTPAKKLKLYIESHESDFETSKEHIPTFRLRKTNVRCVLDCMKMCLNSLIVYFRWIFQSLYEGALCESFVTFLYRGAQQMLLKIFVKKSAIPNNTHTTPPQIQQQQYESTHAVSMTQTPLSLSKQLNSDKDKLVKSGISNTQSSTTTTKDQKLVTDSIIEKDRIISHQLEASIKMYEEHSYNLVLDLDETLVHCNENPLTENAMLIKVSVKNTEKKFFMHQRPHLQEFIKAMAQKFNLYIFTASAGVYAEKIMRVIDQLAVVKGIFSRSSCIFDGKQINKDLSTLGLDLARTILVDNSPACVANNPANSIQIKDFVSDNEDQELLKLANLLEKLHKAAPLNVQSSIRNFTMLP